VLPARLHDTEKRRFPMLSQSTTCIHSKRPSRPICIECYRAERRQTALAGVSVRFWGWVDKTGDADSCWLWQGRRGRADYGILWVAGRGDVGAHRLAYELSIGPIPLGCEVCHKCDTPLCCNPAHLFAAPHKGNMADRDRKTRNGNLKKTHCPAGHPYDEENTYYARNGWRYCRTCIRLRQRRYYWERKERC